MMLGKLPDDVRASIDARFWAQVEKLDGEGACWMWRGSVSRGRPRFRVKRGGVWIIECFAHHYVWERANDPVPWKKHVVQLCGDPLCVRLEHLARADGPEAFWSKVDRSGGADACWPFVGGLKGGYGAVYDGIKPVFAHRRAWQLTHGSMPLERLLRHTCDNPPCCNPLHLVPGDDAANMADCCARGRQNRGAAVRTAVINEATVMALREEYIAGNESMDDLASKHGVSRDIVSAAVSLRTWRHVPVVDDYASRLAAAKHRRMAVPHPGKRKRAA